MYPPVGLGQIRISHRHDLQLAGGRLRVPRGTVLWVPHHGATLRACRLLSLLCWRWVSASGPFLACWLSLAWRGLWTTRPR